jgi:hypothetical protein
LAQRETLGAIGAQPEVFNFFMFCLLLVCVEAKKPASVEAHEGFGALRIGTLRDHESVALPTTLDDRSQGGVARKSQAPEFQFGLCTAHFLGNSSHSQATSRVDVESSHLLGKNYKSLPSRTELPVCFQSLLWQSSCVVPYRQ